MKSKHLLSPQQRFQRLKQVRKIGSPKWVIKSEQVALQLAREGLLHAPMGRPFGKRQAALYEKFVVPHIPK